jgi:hypothetical protein
MHSFLAQADELEARTETLLDYFIVEKEVMEKQRVLFVAHCPIPTVLLSIVVAYVRPTGGDIWSARTAQSLPESISKYVTFDNIEKHTSNTCW